MSDVDVAEAPAPVKKSIVPAKYAGKYKDGGNDDLAKFINDQCNPHKDGFDYEAFFTLCKGNGLDAAKVDHYRNQVLVEKRPGSQGRARMTLRNMLATIARKDGKLKSIEGEEVPLAMPKVALTGAAKAAKEEAAKAA